jgi:starvation-inducible outer membrane lipoprotein
MRLSLFIIIFILSACTSTPQIASLNETDTTLKIQTNISSANNAQYEYKLLQEQRAKEL